MNRKSFRNMWLLTIVVLVGLALLAFQTGKSERMSISNQNMNLQSLRVELDNAARRADLLKELDSLTINEKTATRLDILRHLGLEQSGYDFTVNARQIKPVGDATIFQRNVRLETDLSYQGAMKLVDALHETRKIVITSIELKKSGMPGDMVHLTLEGNIYGLEKTDAL